MATIRGRCEEEETESTENEKQRDARMEDRLSKLPKEFQVQILTSLNTKHAVQTSIMLSKRWVSLWTWIPVLRFRYFDFDHLRVFDNFVYTVLCCRNQFAKLDTLTFHRCLEICSPQIIEDVFDYAFSHGVKQLEVSIVNSTNQTWPIRVDASFESLTGLKLKSSANITCSFLGPRSGSFKNLTDLHLGRAFITDLDPFSGFPVLDKLTLSNCYISTEGKTLSVHALNLSELTISSDQNFNRCELTTPRLRFFEYRGVDFLPLFQTHECVPVLDTMVIGYTIGSYAVWCTRRDESRMFDDLVSFSTLPNAKSLTICTGIVNILSFFPNELAKRSSPFWNLKHLRVDLCSRYKGEIPLNVKAYLLHNSPDAKVTIT